MISWLIQLFNSFSLAGNQDFIIDLSRSSLLEFSLPLLIKYLLHFPFTLNHVGENSLLCFGRVGDAKVDADFNFNGLSPLKVKRVVLLCGMHCCVLMKELSLAKLVSLKEPHQFIFPWVPCAFIIIFYWIITLM